MFICIFVAVAYRWGMRTIIFIFTMLAFLMPALSGETAWQEIAPDAQLRLISSDHRSNDGKLMIALELQMPNQMKTYWRVPGETGIPLQLDFSGSDGVVSHQTHWPYPLREQKDGYLDHVYYGNLVIPIELELNRLSPVIDLSLVMGVCSDICVPVQVSFEHQLDLSSKDRVEALKITQAMAETPIAWDGPEEAISSIKYDAQAQIFTFYVADDLIDIQSIIISSVNGTNLFSVPQLTGQQLTGQAATVAFYGLNPELSEDLLTQPLTLTFLTQSGPYEIVRTIVSQVDISAN